MLTAPSFDEKSQENAMSQQFSDRDAISKKTNSIYNNSTANQILAQALNDNI